jgi:hypothetical protein
MPHQTKTPRRSAGLYRSRCASASDDRLDPVGSWRFGMLPILVAATWRQRYMTCQQAEEEGLI